MALTLVSIITLANVVLAVPVVQRDVACKATIYSEENDTCKSLGLNWGYYDTDILAANTFLNCDDIWVGTPICIPDIPIPATVTYPTPAPLPTPACSQTYISVFGDDCDNIGGQFGITHDDVYNANTFVTCSDIWVGTPICIPAITYPPTTTVSPCKSTYWSVLGDTCQTIASQFGYSDYHQISDANSFLNCDDIWANTPICLPDISSTPTIIVVPVPTCSATYTSVYGDTCDGIAAQYNGITSTQIHDANTFLDCSDIWVGTPICIPAAVIYDPFPTDEPLTFNPTDPVTVDPPTESVTSDPPTDPATVTDLSPTTSAQ